MILLSPGRVDGGATEGSQWTKHFWNFIKGVTAKCRTVEEVGEQMVSIKQSLKSGLKWSHWIHVFSLKVHLSPLVQRHVHVRSACSLCRVQLLERSRERDAGLVVQNGHLVTDNYQIWALSPRNSKMHQLKPSHSLFYVETNNHFMFYNNNPFSKQPLTYGERMNRRDAVCSFWSRMCLIFWM